MHGIEPGRHEPGYVDSGCECAVLISTALNLIFMFFYVYE